MYFRCIFNYRLIESLDYACLLDTVVHVVKVFSFMHPEILKGIGKRNKSKEGLEGSMPGPMGGWLCYTCKSLGYPSTWYSLTTL